MKILVPLHGYIEWNGGLDLIRLLLAVIKAGSNEGEVQIFLAVPDPDLVDRTVLPLLRLWQRRRAVSASRSLAKRALPTLAMELINSYKHYDCGKDGRDIGRLAKRIDADLIFPSMVPVPACGIPRIGYIFDFQHRHLPKLFSQRIMRNRDRQFARIAYHSDGLIVNSNFVRDDVIKLLGVDASHIFKLPFIPFNNSEVSIDTVGVRHKYALDVPYLIICNHFWVHKDHKTALRAFAQLISEPVFGDLHLVLTGDPVDHRNPAHFRELLALADALAIRERTHFLGLIPKSDQLSLLCGARAVVQPTLYEGGPGGGAVYEALGHNIPVVLSDIKVNREICDDRVVFFSAGNASDLAEATKRALKLQNLPRDNTDTDQSIVMSNAGVSLLAFMHQLASR